jgi:hypothetical protein
MSDTNDLFQAFGLSVIVMDVPESNPSIGRVRVHHTHGRISMGYNIATTIVECSEVQLYDYEVWVKMEPKEILDSNGQGTGQYECPKPPNARTMIRKELQCIRFNDDQIFHTAVMTCKGPETGILGVVVAYDPNDIHYRTKYEFAHKTIANLSCFMHQWLIQCGYCTSMRSRLMCSFYIKKAQLAPESSWDPETLTAISHFAVKADTCLSDNAKYDPYLRTCLGKRPSHMSDLIDMLDTVCWNLLHGLGYDPTAHGCDMGSKVSGVSKLTGDGESCCGSTINTDETAHRMLRTRDCARQLAETKEQNAEQAAQLRDLREQMQRLTEPLSGSSSQQGALHLSGSWKQSHSSL